MQESQPRPVPGAREETPSTFQQATRNLQPHSRPRHGSSIFSMLVTGGLLGFALAALRSVARGHVVTLDAYCRLEPGMSYAAVCQTIGRPGDDISVVAASRLYGWRNRDGSRLAALFRDGELVCYGANGLR